MKNHSLTVAQYLKLVNETLGMIPSQEIRIIGEVSDFKISQGKWVNFALKDEEQEAKIPCFTVAMKLKTPIEDGMKIEITGYPKIYERFGRFSLNIQTIKLVGEGALARAYQLLKQRLEKEGYFDLSRKRNIPRFSNRIGLITSTEAAAYGDFIRILNNRWSGTEIIHIPVHVQGQYAVNEIENAFHVFDQMSAHEKPDVLVLTRGGGSLEDLHAFNDERIARAIFQSSIPVVVAVGHERDESLADFVADIRASTPSNAAELVVPDRRDISKEIRNSLDYHHQKIMIELQKKQRITDRSMSVFKTYIETHMQEMRFVVERFRHSFDRFRMSLVATIQYIENNNKTISYNFNTSLISNRNKIDSLVRLFSQFDVQHILKRGFSIVRKGGKIVKSKSCLFSGDHVEIQIADGFVDWEINIENQKSLL